ncbi:hypothetical protein Clacol_008787 [Clathrus columnatus]|uniref:Aldehyde dehydrogenase n=1 Tax=Clathrus columnatus TaxID=1419009 RepID=A0AAV5AM09_9AGAM|nr:hypothetical protein Clacol_008787 [Clathrus columnatus]
MSQGLVYSSIEEIASAYECVNASFRSGTTKPIAFRKKQLLRLASLFKDNLEAFEEAFKKDLGRPVFETHFCDTNAIVNEAILAYNKIDSWVKPEKAPFDLDFFVLSPKIYNEPKGPVLIIGPFNYPLWCIAPITGAIAAGCTVVVKPSELTPAVSQLLAELFPKYLDPSCYIIINGGVQETTKLLSLKWTHILYTGSERVGRIVATAAAQHLTPVTLELGGKSPVVIDKNADFDLAARRILWGKVLNAGQTCVAPDYILVPAEAQSRLVESFNKVYKQFYPDDDPHRPGVLARICAHTHWDRITSLLNQTRGEIVFGGETVREEKYISPTLVKNVRFDDSLMKEEIFGPVLPIVPVPDVDTAIKYINDHDNPLALYVFTKDEKFSTRVRENTLSGMFIVNDVLLEAASSITPFSGVGSSGYGSHRGKYSFDTFVHKRAALRSPNWIDFILGFRFPPYTD